ncbi:hypothetical protein M3C74_06350 [Micrococcus lylae]|uniref:hypothetical protein n=1 Tax=Micrococcus lylae TaxID=1273 RepID=UPI0021A3DE5E|nr:hypothetical protein [Micrococcus lylae]MCT2007981.1 hypothetical protein [Micrococcus lylae]MCT2071455.1 hypothetical protein [Micrococcus lylae]
MSSPASRRRSRALLSVVAVAVFALTACGPKDDASDDSSPSPSSSATEARTLPPMDLAPFTMDVPTHDLDMLPGATLRAIKGTDPDYDGAWFAVPHADTWTKAMEEAVLARVDAFSRDATDQDVRLDVQPLLAVVGPTVAAARIVSTQKREDTAVAASRVLWYDAQQGRVLDPEDLFSESGWSALRREIASRLQEDPDVNEDRLDAAVREPDAAENRRVWDGIVFLEDGSLLLEVDQGSLAPEGAGVLTARVSADMLGPWLSDAGRRGQQAARNPQPLVLQPPQTAAPRTSQAPTSAPQTSQAPTSSGAPSSSSRPTGSESAEPSASESSATPSRSTSPTTGPSPTESASPESPSPSRTETESPTPSPSPSPTESESPTSPTPSPTESKSPTESESPTPSASASTSSDPSPTESESPSPSPTESESPSPSSTETESPKSPSPSPTETESPTSSASASTSPSPSGSPTPSASASTSPGSSRSPNPSSTEGTQSAEPSPSGTVEASATDAQATAPRLG